MKKVAGRKKRKVYWVWWVFPRPSVWRNNKTSLEIPAEEDTGGLCLTELLEMVLSDSGTTTTNSNIFVLFSPRMLITLGKANNQFSALFNSAHPVVNNFQFPQQANVTSPFLGKTFYAPAGSEPVFLAAAQVIQPAPAFSPTGTLLVGVRQWLSVLHGGEGRREGCLPLLL